MQDVQEKPQNYSFNLINRSFIREILLSYGYDKEFTILPFVGTKNKIKTLFFQSKTSSKSVILYEGKTFLFLKEIPWYCADREFINFAYNEQYPQLERVVKIPKLHKNLNNKYYTEINNKYYLLFDFIKGEEWPGEELQAYSVAFNLAQIHKWSFNKDIVAKYRKSIFMSAKDMIELSKQKSLLFYLEESQSELKDYDDITTLVHSDSTPSNYIFKDNELSAILDFDNLKFDNPVRDLAETIASFAITKYVSNTSSYEKILNPINVNLTNAIVKGYLSGLNDDVLGKAIMNNLKPSIKIILLLFHALSFLKGDNAKTQGFDMNIVNLDKIDEIIKKNLN